MARPTLLVLLLAACAAPKPPPREPAPEPEARPLSGQSAAMWHHFWDVAVARDAVISGSVADARAPLLRVAAGESNEPVPADWLPWIDDMRREAQKAEQAETLSAMASVVTAVSAQCAECHRTTRGGPEVNVESLEYKSPERGLSGVMARHAFAADELWVGLTAPSYSSWVRGARALGEFPVPGLEAFETASDAGAGANTHDEEVRADPGMLDKLRAVRALGLKAEAAGQPFEQTQVFSELIALCGECHREHAVGPAAPTYAH
jgi:cytochrome c553